MITLSRKKGHYTLLPVYYTDGEGEVVTVRVNSSTTTIAPSYGTKTLFQLPPIRLLYMPSYVMMSTTPQLCYYAPLLIIRWPMASTVSQPSHFQSWPSNHQSPSPSLLPIRALQGAVLSGGVLFPSRPPFQWKQQEWGCPQFLLGSPSKGGIFIAILLYTVYAIGRSQAQILFIPSEL